MDFKVTSNGLEVAAALKTLADKQVPFAMSRALNASAFDCRAAASASLSRGFKLKKRGMAKAAVQVKKSHKRQWPDIASRVYVPKDFSFLADHELGATRRGVKGHRRTVPSRTIKRTGGGKVRKSQQARALREVSGRTARGGEAKYGRAFELNGHSGLLVRSVKVGSGKRAQRVLQRLYVMSPSIKIKRDPWFFGSVRAEFKRVYKGHFLKEFKVALKSARVRKGSFGSKHARIRYFNARKSVNNG